MIAAMHRKRTTIGLFLLIWASYFGGSVRPTTAAPPESENVKATARRAKHLLVVLIGGIDSDPTPAQIDGSAARQVGNSGLFQLAGDLKKKDGLIPEYFNWNGTRAGRIRDKNPPRAKGIANLIEEHQRRFPDDRVALIGNRWGGHTALEVLTDLREREGMRPLDLAVFLDPSSTGRGPPKPKELPDNVKDAVNYSTRNSFVWGTWEVGDRLKNIDLGDAKSGFVVDGQPQYADKFNPSAHIAAEWDSRIHDDISKRVLALLPDRTGEP